MRNSVFDLLHEHFAASVGGTEALVSGSGSRFRANRFSRFTAYHGNVAVGSNAEVAFHPPSLARSTGLTETTVRRTINLLRASTGLETNFNLQHRWPRVGVSTRNDAMLVIAFVQSMLAIARARRSANDA